jgi:hypothetical protein
MQGLLDMKLISDLGPDAGYGSVTAPHMAASASALTELARLTTADSGLRGARALHVRLSHFEHGAALSLQLYGFPVLPAADEPVIRTPVPGIKDKPPAAGLRPPGATSAKNPLIWAVVANHSVAVQIEHTLAMLATLVARQELTSAGKEVDTSEIDRLAAEVDTQATTAVTDTLRSQGWRAAAEAVSARSAVAGLPLAVTYSPVLMDAGALALRAPILRRVYNEIPEIRSAIDKVATTLSQGLMTVGGGSERVAAFARDLLDVGSTRTYLAHLARDALVCGNGYLSFGTVPDEDIRLLLPEKVTILNPETVRVTDGGSDVVHTRVLHETGAEQQDSAYGLSILEPFVQPQNERELMLERIEIAKAWDQLPAPEPARSAALRNVPLARRRLEAIARNIRATLGATRTLRVEPPADLYFPGHELMAPAAAGLSLVEGESPAGAGVGGQG